MAAGSSSSDQLSSSAGEKLVFDLSGDEKSKYMKLTGAGVESIPESKQSCLMEGLSFPVEKGKASMSGVGDSDEIPDESVVLQKSNTEPEISYVTNCFSNFEKEKGKAIADGSGNLGQIIGRGKNVGNIEDIGNLIAKIKEELSSGSGNLGQVIGRGKNVGNIEDIRNFIAKIKEELSNMPVTHDNQSRKRDHRTRMLDSIEYVRNLFNNFEKEKGKAIADGSGNLGQIIGLGKNAGNIEDIRNLTAKIKEYRKVKMSPIRELCKL